MHAYKREESLVPWFGDHICMYQCSAVDFGVIHAYEREQERGIDRWSIPGQGDLGYKFAQSVATLEDIFDGQIFGSRRIYTVR